MAYPRTRWIGGVTCRRRGAIGEFSYREIAVVAHDKKHAMYRIMDYAHEDGWEVNHIFNVRRERLSWTETYIR